MCVNEYMHACIHPHACMHISVYVWGRIDVRVIVFEYVPPSKSIHMSTSLCIYADITSL